MALCEEALCEQQNIIKKQEFIPQTLTSVQCGWSELAIHGLGIIIKFL